MENEFTLEQLKKRGLKPKDDDLIAYSETLFELSLKAMKQMKETVQASIDSHGGNMTAMEEKLMDKINALGNGMQQFKDDMQDAKYRHSEGMDKLAAKLGQEIKDLAESMPEMPDLSILEERIDAVEAKIPKIPEPTPAETGDSIIDKINDMPTTGRKAKKIDASHIKNLPKAGPGGGITGMAYPQAGQNIAVSGRTVSLHIPIQSTEPSNPLLNDLWIDNS